MISSNEPRTAAALVIGNELLTGKIQDANVAVLARDLFGLGVVLRRVIFCPDEVDVICRDLDALRRDHDYVFTSGGVGPTHDDVTMEAVAQAFHQRLVSSPEIEELLREYFGERCTERHLRMAELPEGAQLVTASTGRWPVVKVGNVFVLPGLPEIFRRKLPILREHLGGGVPFISKAVATRGDEGEIADLLERISDDHPAVSIGSYPRWGDDLVRVVVTFDGREPEAVDRAMAALIDALPRDQIIDSETTNRGAPT